MIRKSTLLRQCFLSDTIVRIMGAHNGLGAKLIEKNGFDGIWASGLEISTAHAVPDANILTMTESLNVAIAINEATSLPVVCDCDTGYGNASNVMHMVRKYEAADLAAVVIEDKVFPKVNSFIPGRQELAPVEEFVGKIQAAKNAQQHPDFMVFARVESLIAGWGQEDALRRARAYADAGADGIVIHSKLTTSDEVIAFAREWKRRTPLVVIPTMFYDVTASELQRHGFRMVIYANHGLRAAMRAMDETFRAIRQTGSTAAVEDRIASMKEVFEVQGMSGLKDEEKRFLKKVSIQAVIPAAGEHRGRGLSELLADRPLCMLDVCGKTLIERQMDLLRSCGVNDILIVTGHRGDKITAEGATVLCNDKHDRTNIAYSTLLPQDLLRGRCVTLYSDIIFDRHILEQLLTSPYQVTLVVDRAYRTLPFREKALDLVIIQDPARNPAGRRLSPNTIKPVRRIGKAILREEADFEFIGLAFFREEGIAGLKRAWNDALSCFEGKPFYEASSVEQAGFNDLVQYLIDRNYPVHAMEIEHGWSEIHSVDDYRRVCSHFASSSTLAGKK